MNTLLRAQRDSPSGMALVITLLTLALMTIIVVAFLGTMNWEVQASQRSYEGQRARAIATLGMNTAVAQLRTALGPWDAPYGTAANPGGFETNGPTNFWSISPGILTSWSYTNTAPITNYALFSQPADGATNLANLNAQAQDGTYPILGTSTGLPVYWVNVLADPQFAAANTNQIVGRYAFWMDDENSKININTADGVLNTNQPSMNGPGTYMGAGTPSEVSLQALQSSSGTPLPASAASGIVSIARTVGFNSPREIQRVPGVSSDLYTNNIFNLTVMSRSPDFNIFGQPKMALIPVNNRHSPLPLPSEAFYNCATLQPLRELFPSYTGNTGTAVAGVLPALSLTNLNSPRSGPVSNPSTKWPLAFPLNFAPFYYFIWDPIGQPAGDDSPWDNGQVIASYLAGTNAMGQPITWPAFPGSSAKSYSDKYSPRQIDSITMQILDMAEKDISPDWGNYFAAQTRTSDYAFRGWLSGQLVNGIGRSPKLDKVLMSFETAGGNSSLQIAPSVKTQLFLEMWFPSAYQGTSFFHNSEFNNPDGSWDGFSTGPQFQGNVINCQDAGQISSYISATGQYTNNSVETPAPLPKLLANGGSSTVDVASYWGNNLLQTYYTNSSLSEGGIAGVDWNGNNPNFPDQDQSLATNHPYRLTSGVYMGDGQATTTTYPVSPIFEMGLILPNNVTVIPAISTWAPGEYRTVANAPSMNLKSDMSTNAAGGTFYVRGGIQYLDENYFSQTSLTGAVPLDSMRGIAWPSGNPTPVFTPNPNQVFTDDVLTNSATAPYTNNIAAVIPINASVSVPANGSLNTSTVYVYARVQDPLVNKFPGDWIESTSTSSPPPNVDSDGMQWQTAGTTDQGYNTTYSTNSESAEQASFSDITDAQFPVTSADPDSYWLPTIDNCAMLNSPTTGATPEPPQMPRTARFPSVGYLQYVRTGIIPDDEVNTPYAQQHGTPFRLLNFNASTDSSQKILNKSYPDWAMLDLFYVPSSLLGYGSPYEAFAGGANATAVAENWALYCTQVTYANTNVVNNMFQYGTYGGATSGRINPNGSVMYTTNVNLPTPGITRSVPLQALFHGLTVNQTHNGAVALTGNDFHAPNWTGGTTVNETAVAAAIINYLTTNPNGVNGGPAPLRMPAEICNIPGIFGSSSGLGSPVNPYRNDFVRQVVGNLTTQSNTFSVWVAGQAITKRKGNSTYGIYEPGDQITASVRYHYIVERDLDTGADGLFGNSSAAGIDGLVGTLDDPADPVYNPPNPAYVYRIIYAEEIQ